MADEVNVDQNPVPVSPQEPTVDVPISQTGSTPADMPSVAPESAREGVVSVPVEDQNEVVNEPKSQDVPVSVQQDQTGLIHGFVQALLVKAQAKIQFNKQKKLDKLVRFAQEKGIVTNDDVQKLLRVSDATATRYLMKLVEQGRLTRVGNLRDAKYQFLG